MCKLNPGSSSRTIKSCLIYFAFLVMFYSDRLIQPGDTLLSGVYAVVLGGVTSHWVVTLTPGSSICGNSP